MIKEQEMINNMDTKKTFQVPANLDGVSPLKDGGVSLRFHTQELTAQEKLHLLNKYQSFGYVLFKENSFTDADIPKEDASDETKKPSQRLRAVIFIMWKQKGMEGSFDQFYNKKMEYIISQFKEKLEPDMN